MFFTIALLKISDNTGVTDIFCKKK